MGSNHRREEYLILLGCNILKMISRHQECVKNIVVGSDWDLALEWFQSVEENGLGCVGNEGDHAKQVFDVKVRESESIPPESLKRISCIMVGFPDPSL